MLKCQQKTEKENIVICNKMMERNGLKNYKIPIQNCEHCQKNEEQFLDSMLRQYHFKAISFKDVNTDIDESIKYFQDTKEKNLDMLSSSVSQRCVSEDVLKDDNYIYFMKNIRKINFEEINENIKDDESLYQSFKRNCLKFLSSNDMKDRMATSLKQHFSMLRIRKDFFIRLVEEEMSRFDEDFLDSLDELYIEQEENLQKKKKDINFRPVPKVSLIDKIKGAKTAFKRYSDFSKQKGEETVWVSEKEMTERQVCCSKCTDGGTCPYCGCQIKKSWFLPLGKSELKTEGCPNKDTYPHLKNFPPKNYWKVCEQKTSIVFFWDSNSPLELSKILDDLKKNATGEIEIIVGVKIGLYLSFSRSVEYVTLIKNAKDVEELKSKATGDYIFSLEDCDYEDFGYDTKLKYEHI